MVECNYNYNIRIYFCSQISSINPCLFEILSGKDPTDAYLDDMCSAAPGPINFTMFLTMFGDKLNGTDPEDVIKNAFACFDEDGSGKVKDNIL